MSLLAYEMAIRPTANRMAHAAWLLGDPRRTLQPDETVTGPLVVEALPSVEDDVLLVVVVVDLVVVVPPGDPVPVVSEASVDELVDRVGVVVDVSKSSEGETLLLVVVVLCSDVVALGKLVVSIGGGASVVVIVEPPPPPTPPLEQCPSDVQTSPASQ